LRTAGSDALAATDAGAFVAVAQRNFGGSARAGVRDFWRGLGARLRAGALAGLPPRAASTGKRAIWAGHFELGEEERPWIEAIIDRFVVGPGIDRQVLASLEHGLKVGDGFLSFHPEGLSRTAMKTFWKDFGCAQHRLISASLHHGNFTFNDPAGACRTCAGLGTSKRVHPTLLVPDPSRSLGDGAIVKEAFNNDKNSWGGRWLHSLAQHYGFSLDTPFSELSQVGQGPRLQREQR
jgi:excinuclease ABC subunit A